MKMQTWKDEDFKEYYIDKKIKRMLLKAKDQVINHDWDRVYIIDGGEGSGKSLLGLQLGYFLDRTLNIDRVTFTAQDFGKAIDNAKKGQVVIFDEAFNGLSSSGSMTAMNRFLVRKLMECRQKNLIIIIILPTIFLLQKYAAVFRSRGLFHVFVSKKGVRGYYKFYTLDNKKKLYLNGQKYYSYSVPYISKVYVFRGKYPMGDEFEKVYREKKLKSLEVNLGEKEKVHRDTPRLALLSYLLKTKFNMPFKDQVAYFEEHKQPIDPHTLSGKVQTFVKNAIL